MKELMRTPSIDESGLLRKAQTHLSAERYQQASDLFKQLLEQADNPDYRRQLAQCYLQWAVSQAALGLPKQASALWESYVSYAEAPLAAQDSYIIWLLAGKEDQKAYAALESLAADKLDRDYPELAVLLGFLLLAGQDELAQYLPPDSALLKHWRIVQDALDAYRDHQFGPCDQALKQLPFRSAFRDFRILLKAQLLAGSSIAQAGALLAKIPVLSPYRAMADAVAAYMQTGAAFVAAMSRLEAGHRRTIAQAKVLSANQVQLVEAISKQGGWLFNAFRFNLALQYRSLFGDETAQAYCLSQLEYYPAGFQDYLNYFGVRDAFEQNRVQALLYEKAKNSYEAQHYWRQCVAILQKDLPANNKKIALILRHMADSVSQDEAVDLLIESLGYEPAHRSSYLAILAFYGEHKPNATKYLHWLQRSLSCFPDDTGILAHAIRSALKRKAFKQALETAQTLLKVDPANKLAKQVLFDEHIAQVRRLIRSQDFQSLEEQIQNLEQWAVDKDDFAQIDLLRGFYIWLAQDQQQGLAVIIHVLKKLNDGPVSMQFQALMEAAMLNQTCPISLSVDDQLLSRQQLYKLITLITHYDRQVIDRKSLLKALNAIEAPLKHSIAKLHDDEALLLSWCGVLEQIGHFELLRHCVDLLDDAKQKPVWLYYQTLAACLGDVSRLDHVTLFQLQNAMAKARSENDSKAVLLIGRLIEQSQNSANPFAFDEEALEVDDHTQDEDLYQALFGGLPVDLMEKLEQKVQDIMLETDPEQFAEQTIRQYSHTFDPHTLTSLFDDPDFFASVCLLAAAEGLKIDVGISMEDVVARFEATLS